ncbi:uncharacterized protein LOC131937063 [Physella acuta]|uniref:uncharacterized protein LOC131937063 n=1 Tax=Physella acuta TaxID=109671 RepID=UPI0027DB7BBD|nr:uncharacterized protein LOC131937063 [Physella acuta]
MASTTLLLLCLALGTGLCSGQAGQTSTGLPSAKLIRFIQSVTGYVSGEKQLTEEREKNFLHPHSLIEGYFIPVDVKIFNPIPTFYLEELVNKVTYRRHIVTVTEDNDGLIIVTPYNVTVDVKFQRNGTLDTNAVYNIKREELESHENCVAVYIEVEENVFHGSWPDCYSSIELHNPKYSNIWTCHYVTTLVSHPGAKEGATPVPFILNKANRPLLPYMTRGQVYKSTCGPKPVERELKWPSA